MSVTLVVFTCARYPQKSQMTSAHLKFFLPMRFSVPLRLHLGQLQSWMTIFSPNSPDFCLAVVMVC